MTPAAPTRETRTEPDAFAYAAPPGARDEAVGPDGTARPHWGPFFTALRGLGWAELTRRWEESRQVIRDNGVTYNVYGDPRGLDRPWQLDPIPLLVDPADARRLGDGLTQRGRLLDALLADLYGPQRTLRDGLLPAELVFGNRRFLRPCHNLAVPHGRYLHLYAADLGRGPDGAFVVLGDRTQAPSGAGYALENRIVLSRALPETFQEGNVHRLALFYRTLRDSLRALAPRNKENPRVVLLTPGPYNETYFEHAYLARYLGFTLVEGGDLTVRDARVFLKLLGGLVPVDVVLRRLDDDYCDPVELRGDSFLGVPGLVQAVRAGNVAVANALGTGLVEAAGLTPYLPGLCTALLGEPLRLSSAPTWWCGDPKGLSHVLAHLDRMVVKPSRNKSRFRPVFADRLPIADRAALVERMREKPGDYIGQERLPLSTVPVLTSGRLEPRHVVLRAFLTADADGGYMVMPGGLTRVTAAAGSLDVSMQEGGGSKDTWVLSSKPVNTFTLLSSSFRPVELSRGGLDLPSRAADNLFWLGRHVERAEGLVRLVRVVFSRLADVGGFGDVPELATLIRAGMDDPPDETPDPPRASALIGRVLDLLYDDAVVGGLPSILRDVHRLARSVRDRVSADMWRILVGLQFPADGHGKGGRNRGTPGDRLDELNRLVGSLAAFGGLAMESMSRGQAWRFLDMGRRLERAIGLVRLLRGTLAEVGPNETAVLEALLETADSSMTYRRRYLSSAAAGPVLDLLLADEANPRSVVFQLVRLAEAVDDLPQPTGLAARTPEQRIVLGAVTAAQLADIPSLADPVEGVRPGLAALLDQIGDDLPHLSDALTRTYLTHLQPARHLSGPGGMA